MTTIKQFRDPQLSTDGSVVGFYEREFYTFSNFSSFQVDWEGRRWPTSEHAYQAARYMGTSPEFVEKIFNARSAHEAWEIAQSNKQHDRQNWPEIKAEVMLDICRHKLQQNPYVKHKLLLTNDELLVEDSPIDSFWGWGPDGQGRNELGKVWMKLREELRNNEL
ncbi:MAG: NADAR family protein [Candidatus Microsaccharimonas sp.]